MTPTEIMDELERFKDRVNADGKATLDRLKDALKPHLEQPQIIEKEVVVEKPITVEVLALGDRRTEPRDPNEKDQHTAEKLGLTR